MILRGRKGEGTGLVPHPPFLCCWRDASPITVTVLLLGQVRIADPPPVR